MIIVLSSSFDELVEQKSVGKNLATKRKISEIETETETNTTEKQKTDILHSEKETAETTEKQKEKEEPKKKKEKLKLHVFIIITFYRFLFNLIHFPFLSFPFSFLLPSFKDF